MDEAEKTNETMNLSNRIKQDWLIAMLGMTTGATYEVRQDSNGLRYLMRIVELKPAEFRGAKPC